MAEAEPVGPFPSPPLRVLLVEDDDDHADLVEALLADTQAPPVDLTRAKTVEAALGALGTARVGAPFDVVLCDQRLPDSEIWETIEQVVEAAGDAPVVALTSIGDLDVALDAMRQGAQDYLVKSEMTPEVLRRTVQYAVERARHTAQLQALNEALADRVLEQTARVRALAARLASAEQAERRRIAQLLHDDLQQQLHGLAITLDLLGRAPSEEERGRLAERATRTLHEATALTRTLATDLNPPALATHRLGTALQWLAERNREAHGLDVEVVGDAEVSDPTLRALLYHLVRELLFNVAKHAETRRARIALEGHAGHVVIRVEDEGTGFDPAVLHAEVAGFGLASVRERLEAVGGHLGVESARGAGTRVTVAVPLAVEACPVPED